MWDCSIAGGKALNRVQTPGELSQALLEAMTPVSPKKKNRWDTIRFLIVHRWQAKLVSFGIVSLLWLMLAGQQDFEVTLSLPLQVKDLPRTMQILDSSTQRVDVRVRGLRKDASILNQDNVVAEMDLSLARAGKKSFPITRENILLPNDRVQVVKIEPSQVEFKFAKEK